MRAASSNSPNVKQISPDRLVTIYSIRPHARVAAGVSVFVRYDPLQDSSVPYRDRSQMERVRRIRFDIDPTMVDRTAVSLQVDTTMPIGVLRDVVQRSQSLFIRPVVVDLLARRDHSKKELLRKLRQRGFSSDLAEATIDEMEDRGYQDDRRFAESWVRSAMRKSGRGRRYLIATLTERGVETEIAEEVTDEYETEHPGCFAQALEHAIASIVGKRPSGIVDLTDREKRNAITRLIRRGFSMKEIQKTFH